MVNIEIRRRFRIGCDSAGWRTIEAVAGFPDELLVNGKPATWEEAERKVAGLRKSEDWQATVTPLSPDGTFRPKDFSYDPAFDA